MESQELIERLNSCPPGNEGWRDFEDVCIDIINFLFVPPLTRPRIQARTLSGSERRDAIYPNRNLNTNNIWAQLRTELKARFILFEFKNHNKQLITIGDVNQARNYLTPNFGRLAIICSPKQPSKNAKRLRNSIFSREQRVVLFINKEQMIEMIYTKEREEDPAGIIMDMVEDFYIQHE